MAENAGRIWYEFGVETSDVLKAQTVTTKATDSMSNSFKKVDASVKNFNTQTTKAAQGVRKGVQANLGQAGIQVQQFVGQLQGGQSAMVALAQQSADLGIVLGAPLVGVFVSLAAVLAGTLAPAIFGSVSNIEKLQKAIENTKAIMTVGADGVAEYTEEIKRLNTASESLAKIKIALAMTQNAQALNSARKEALALGAELIGFQEYAEDAAERLTGLTSKSGEILDIAAAMRTFNSAASDDKKLKALDQAEKALLSMRKDGVFPTKELAEYAGEFFAFSDAVRQAIESNKALKTSQDDLEESNKVTKESFNDMKNALRGNIIELNSGKRAALEWSLLMQGLDADQRAEILTLYDKKEALEAANSATEEAIKANKQYEESVRKKTESDLAWFEQQEKWLKGQEKKETESNITFAQGIINKGKSPEEQMAEQYARLKNLRDTDIENAKLYQEAMTSLEQQAMESREAMWSESYQRIGQQAADSMADYLTGVETAEDATRMLASTIVSEVIQSLVQMGLSAITQSMTTTAAATTGIATTTGAAVASTGVMATAQGTAMATVAGAVGTIAGGLATAWAPAAAFASLATLGTNAGPAIAGIYSTMAATLGAQLVGGIVSNGITAATGFDGTSGGRQYGGPVSNGMYRVNETGVPEVYSQGGKDYLMNTKNANVTPLDKAQSGQAWNVNVQNYGPEKAYVTIDEVNRAVNVGIGREAKKASQGRGSMYQGLSKGTNVKNNARR